MSGISGIEPRVLRAKSNPAFAHRPSLRSGRVQRLFVILFLFFIDANILLDSEFNKCDKPYLRIHFLAVCCLRI